MGHVYLKQLSLEKKLLLIGIISCGITGSILFPPFYSKSLTPKMAKDL
jgi:hypothetical protein